MASTEVDRRHSAVAKDFRRKSAGRKRAIAKFRAANDRCLFPVFDTNGQVGDIEPYIVFDVVVAVVARC